MSLSRRRSDDRGHALAREPYAIAATREDGSLAEVLASRRPRGPKRLKIGKETTHGLLSRRRLMSMKGRHHTTTGRRDHTLVLLRDVVGIRRRRLQNSVVDLHT